MKNVTKIATGLAGIALVSATLFTACKKDSKDDDSGSGQSGYANSDAVASSNLVAKFTFDNTINDAKGNISNGTIHNTTYGTGIKNQSFQGSADGYILYTTVADAIKNLKSVTVSYWVKTTQHVDGAKSMFQLINDSNWIGNLFVLQESGVVGNDSLRLKFTFDKWDAEAWKEQWVDYAGTNRITGVVDKWTHVAFTYDATTSQSYIYVNGKKITMPESVSKRYQNDPASGGAALGELKFANANRFMFGAYKQMADGSPDAWMKNYDGGLDEFRIYDKALADADIQAIYELENAGK